MFLVTPDGKNEGMTQHKFPRVKCQNRNKWSCIVWFLLRSEVPQDEFHSSDQCYSAQVHFCIPPTASKADLPIFGTLHQHTFYRQIPHVNSYHQSTLATDYAHFKLLKIITNFLFF